MGVMLEASIGRIFNRIIEWIQGIITEVLSWEGVWRTTGAVIEGIIDVLTQTFGTLFRTFSNIFAEIEKLLDGQQTLWETFKNIFAEAVAGIITIVSNMVTRIVSAFQNVDWVQLGKDIIQGLINGIKSLAGAVVDTAAEIGEDIADTFSRILGIESPSKVFRQFGEFIIQGLAIGLERDDRATKAAEQAGMDVIDSFNGIEQQASPLFDRMSSAIDQFVETGKLSFQDFTRSVISDLAKIQLKAAASSILGGIFGGFGGGGGGVGFDVGGLFSFAGGGFTGSGVRAGGVDGRGGFPAIVHPGETIIDHRGGGARAINSAGSGIATTNNHGGDTINISITVNGDGEMSGQAREQLKAEVAGAVIKAQHEQRRRQGNPARNLRR